MMVTILIIMQTFDRKRVHPEDPDNLLFWSVKWGVTTKDVKDAILNTGHLEVPELRSYLRKDSLLFHPVNGVRFLFTQTAKALF